MDVGLGELWTGAVVCGVWEERKGGREGEILGGKASSNMDWTMGSLSHTLPSAPSCVTVCDSTPLASGLLLFLDSDQIDLPRLMRINSPHHLSIAQHHTTINVCPFTLTSIISFLSYENNFCPVNNITHPFLFPFPSLRSHSLSAPARYHITIAIAVEEALRSTAPEPPAVQEEEKRQNFRGRWNPLGVPFGRRTHSFRPSVFRGRRF